MIGIKEIEDSIGISIFTETDINGLKEIINPLLKGKIYNVSIGDLIKRISKLLYLNESQNNKSNEYMVLTQIVSKDHERLISNSISASKDVDNVKIIQKAIKKGNLEYIVNVMENHWLSEDCSKTSKTSIAKNLEFLIDNECEKLLSNNYTKNRVDRMAEGIKIINGITRTLLEGKLNFVKSPLLSCRIKRS